MVRTLLRVLYLSIFLLGLTIFSIPYAQRIRVQQEMDSSIQTFQNQETTVSAQTETLPTEETRAYAELWEEMCAYNEKIHDEQQVSLSSRAALQKAAFQLRDYGRNDEAFAVLNIPKINLDMPVYLGATDQNLANGAAHLSQTSLPIGGENTNCVIAGHRGWNGAYYFRYVPDLRKGDVVTLQNLWETLSYQVVETKIIAPSDVDAIRIQEGRELLTLLTCHPYASGGKQRFLVICERVYKEDDYGKTDGG